MGKTVVKTTPKRRSIKLRIEYSGSVTRDVREPSNKIGYDYDPEDEDEKGYTENTPSTVTVDDYLSETLGLEDTQHIVKVVQITPEKCSVINDNFNMERREEAGVQCPRDAKYLVNGQTMCMVHMVSAIDDGSEPTVTVIPEERTISPVDLSAPIRSLFALPE